MRMARARSSRRTARAVVAIAVLLAVPAHVSAADGAAAPIPSAIARTRRFGVHRPVTWDVVPAAQTDPARPAALHPRTVPYFTDAFTSGGQDYTYKMVGRSPRTSHGRTVLP